MEPPALPTPSKPSVPEQLMHKNRLQEYAQRSALPLPVYQTVNEGLPHDPKFRSTVIVDGATYKSSQRFRNRKAAEQDVAKLALDSIMKKIKDEGLPQISQDTVFCKSILNEFAVKMNLPKPSYSTPQSGDLLPIFTSSLVFDGKTYVGNPGKNKKEAEQKAARTVIQSILGTSSSRTVLTEIIKSKSRLFAAIHKVTSELKKPKEELVYDSLVGLAGNEKVSLKYLSSGPSQRIRDPETGISGIHSDHNSVLNEGNAMTACTSPLSVDCTRLSKRQRKRNNQELAKRLKTEQQ
ncbi:double-stranded RNA-binding protein 4-like isoform X2 [Aristolochia californica]|uniref:double-stranded RNA-binding protein 4-like isoform X2 n=1 Tax=Aristolochia californica TaxID=171875 RepID=UPI0035D5587A